MKNDDQPHRHDESREIVAVGFALFLVLMGIGGCAHLTNFKF